MLTKTLLLVLFLLAKQVLSANVLFVTPVLSPSHHIWHSALAMGLVERGHNVTMLTHETDTSANHKNFTVLTMEGMYKKMSEQFPPYKVDHIGVLETITTLLDITTFIIGQDYKTSGFKALMNYPKKFIFDIILFDSTWVRYMYCLIEHFNYPPVIALTPFLLPPSTSIAFGSYPLTAQDPHQLTDYTNKMNLRQRAWNLVTTYVEVFYIKYIFGRREEALVKAHYPKITHTLDQLEKNISILLTNSDPVLDYPRALPPNIIPVGGLHIKPAKPLPEYFRKIMEEAEHGVVLFSLGTNVKSETLGPAVINALLKAFSELPQIVFWKFETDLKLDLPKNVIMSKWMPQNDILGHPNIKLFITHGGALSSQEALYHGVPMIGIPCLSDQLRNINKLVLQEVAVKIGYKELTLKTFQGALDTVLKNDSYYKTAKALSIKYRDQPQSPLEKAVFWVEYIIRHGNANHLVTPARDMPFYQFANYDIVSLFTLLLFSFYMSTMLIITLCKIFISLLTYKNVPLKKMKTK